MSNQTGIDYYDTLLSRIHGGVCAFQSLRTHRRERTREDTSPPQRVSPSSASPPQPPAASSHTASDGPPVFEPQGFIAHEGRVLPLFGDVRAVFHGAPPPVEASQSPPPRSAPMPEELPLLVQDPPSSRPASASTLKLPLPTPPTRLGLGRPTEAPAPAPEPSAPSAPRPAAASDGASATTPQHGAPSEPGLEALLASRAQMEATRLEQVHAEHRACLATLLHEHRAELHAQADADAARATQIVRELLAEHRAELTRSADAQAGTLALVLSQHREEMEATRTEQPEAGSSPQSKALCTALMEQAKHQREAHEDLVQHIGAVTTIVADLGQTVGMLAVAAAHKAQHSGLPTRPTFTPPPRSEPAAAAPHVPSARSAALPQVDPVGVTASRIEPASSRVEPTAPTSPALSPAAANQPRGRADLSLSHAITHEPAHRRPIHLRLAQEAAERTRVQEALEGDPDDDLGTDPVDESDDPRPRRRLPPCTDLVQHEEQERDHDA